MTLVIATRGIDLSVGAVAAISGALRLPADHQRCLRTAVAAVLDRRRRSRSGGAARGLWNGFLVAVLGIQPIVATLMLMVAGRGVAQLITDGQNVTTTAPRTN